ncbi:MAG: hypothetical protein AAF266_03480 [Planctomycetota bacterium]
MPLNWDTDDDFGEVVDTLEPIALRRQGCVDNADTLAAWRFREEASDINAGVRKVDLTWQLPLADLPDPPRPGDVVVDEAGLETMLEEIVRLRGSSRYACRGRRIELDRHETERFDIERPIYVSTSEGPVLDRWERGRLAVEGFFDLKSPGPPQRYDVSIVCDADLEVGYRVSRHRGGAFLVESLAEPIGMNGYRLLTIVDESASAAAA